MRRTRHRSRGFGPLLLELWPGRNLVVESTGTDLLPELMLDAGASAIVESAPPSIRPTFAAPATAVVESADPDLGSLVPLPAADVAASVPPTMS